MVVHEGLHEYMVYTYGHGKCELKSLWFKLIYSLIVYEMEFYPEIFIFSIDFP